MKREILLYGSSRINSDILYFSGVSVSDPFYAFTLGGKKCGILNALEVGRVKKNCALDRVFDGTKAARTLAEKTGTRPDDCDVAIAILKSAKVSAITIPADFPVLAADRFLSAGFDVKICEGEMFPKRAVKTAIELSSIKEANAAASSGFSAVEKILRESTIENGYVIYRDKKLTSETLVAEIEKACIDCGADAMDTIAAAGVQACDPHECGHGAIRANSLIVVDIFPRLRSSGYFGDMTRTFLKGEPSKAQCKLVECVAEAQKLALSQVREGADGMNVHAEVEKFFAKNGYKTYEKNGSWCGFFHSTGHGLGLDVHESPSLGRRECILKKGNVVTVEPALYYPEIGGCRIEDNVVVTKTGCKLLSSYPYDWIIE